MSALFDFKAFLTVVLLTICTCTYIKAKFPSLLNDRTGFRGLFWKAARIGVGSMRACTDISSWQQHMEKIGRNLRCLHGVKRQLMLCFACSLTCDLSMLTGERLSPWVALSCIIMGLTTLFA